MNIIFISNYYNHHQAPISQVFYRLLDGNYKFIETNEMGEERKKLGYKALTDNFVEKATHNTQQLLEDINQADVVIKGDTPLFYIKERFKNNKLVFCYEERIYKILPEWYEMPARAIKYWYLKGRYKSNYLLCSSAFAYADYHKTRTFENRAYKWGYFPAAKEYDINKLMNSKVKNKILWIGRLIDWKHPDDVLKVAKKLKTDGYSFSIDIGGIGNMEDELNQMSEDLNLTDCVTFLGSIPSEKVRDHMENAGIFLFTSDRYEGWGAVLNESMNTGCAVVASHAIGSVPFLIKNNENGLVYHSGNVEELYSKVKYLLDNPLEQERLGYKAYKTIISEWNANVAAERLTNLSKHILDGEKSPDLYKSGPCSKALITKDEWF